VYRIEVAPTARRDLEKLKGRMARSDLERMQIAMGCLAGAPRLEDASPVEGLGGAYRVGVGDYWVVYDIYDGEGLVLILRVARRNEGILV